MGRLDPARPPRLVLRFAVYAAAGLALAAAGVVAFTSRDALARAERNASIHAGFVARTILRERLRPADFERTVTGRRRSELDRLFARQVLVGGGLRVALYSRAGRVTYSSGGTLAAGSAHSQKAREALTEANVTEVARLRRSGPAGEGVKVLGTYARVRLGGKAGGVFRLDQDYRPIAQAARETVVPTAAVLGAALLALYVLLFPVLRRVTKRLRRQMDAIEHQALHDVLTDLPNRILFRDRVEQALLAEARDPRGLAVMLIDLDRFKEVNDTLGHESGDMLLREIGNRLAESLRSSDTVARLGGDEFAVLARSVADPETALDVARRLHLALETPFSLKGLSLEVEASIGIALAPEHGRDVDTLIRYADVAMYLSKESHSGAEVYSPERDDHSPDRLKLVSDLRRALRRGELVLCYQPKVAVTTGDVIGFEALVRWQHPEHGLLGPDRFIPVAEHTGLIRPLTRYVLDAALRQCRAWRIQGLEIAVAVNLSGRDLLDLHLPDEVQATLERWQVDPSRLELEITENTILSDPVRTRAILTRLKELKVRVAIDDFGSGYSSLGYLKRLPLDVLKIDKSFVLNMEKDDDDAAIVRSTIDLAHNLGLEVVAEGVETAEILETLRSLRCDAAQGYYFGRPLAVVEVPGWLAAARRTAEPEAWEAAAG